MANKQIVTYISEYLGKGYPRDSITNSLLDQGFDLNSINAAFEEAYPTKMNHPFRQTSIDHAAMPKRKLELALLGIFIIIVLAGGITFVAVNKAPASILPTTTVRQAGATTTVTTALTPSSTAPPVTTPLGNNQPLQPDTQHTTATFNPGDMRISSLKLCNSVSDSFECDENTAGEFRLGQPVYIYFKLVLRAKMKSGSYVVGFTEDRVVYDQQSTSIPSLTADSMMNIQREVSGEGLYTLPAYNLIETATDETAGGYRAVITLKDKFSDEEITKEISYTLI